MTETGFHKVCIYGAGAIGGWLGARLAAVGCELSVVARGATLQALRDQGLRLRPDGQALAAPVSMPRFRTRSRRTSDTSSGAI